MLMKSGANYSGGAGEDFFYIQEVSIIPNLRIGKIFNLTLYGIPTR